MDIHWMMTSSENWLGYYSLSAQRSVESGKATYKSYVDAAKTAGIISVALTFDGQNDSLQLCKRMCHGTHGWDELLRGFS
jgi:hypothetical protein